MENNLELMNDLPNFSKTSTSHGENSYQKNFNEIKNHDFLNLTDYNRNSRYSESPFINGPSNSYTHDNPYDKISISEMNSNQMKCEKNEIDRSGENYTCPHCFKTFKTKLCLRYHVDVHNPRKPYVCSMPGCDRAFRTPKYLKNHCDEFHRKQPKKYQCPVDCCSAVFHRKTHLKRHLSTHSDSEKKFSCSWPECRYRTCSREKLNIHYCIHTGEKEYNCILCNFKGIEKSDLSEHYRIEHAKNPEVQLSSTTTLSSNILHSNSSVSSMSNQVCGNLETLSNCDSSKNWNSSKMSQLSGCEKAETMSEFSNSQKNESSNVLPMILTLLEKTESTQMNDDEIQNTQNYVKSLLPPIATGSILQDQIENIYDELIDKLQINANSNEYLHDAYVNSDPLNEDELHVIEILEHQLRSGSVLTVPYPPRKRGRRPKLQQKLRPYLEKLFNIETCVADMLISLLCCHHGYGWNSFALSQKKDETTSNLEDGDYDEDDEDGEVGEIDDNETLKKEYHNNNDARLLMQNARVFHEQNDDICQSYSNNSSLNALTTQSNRYNTNCGSMNPNLVSNKSGNNCANNCGGYPMVNSNVPSMAQFSSSSTLYSNPSFVSGQSNNNNANSESGYCSSSQESHSQLPITSPNTCESPRTSSNNSSSMNPYQISSIGVVSPNSSSTNSNSSNPSKNILNNNNNHVSVDHLQFLSEMGAKYTTTNNTIHNNSNPNHANRFPVARQQNFEGKQLQKKKSYPGYSQTTSSSTSNHGTKPYASNFPTTNPNILWQQTDKSSLYNGSFPSVIEPHSLAYHNSFRRHHHQHPLESIVSGRPSNSGSSATVVQNNSNSVPSDDQSRTSSSSSLLTENINHCSVNSEYSPFPTTHYPQNNSYHGHSSNNNINNNNNNNNSTIGNNCNQLQTSFMQNNHHQHTEYNNTMYNTMSYPGNYENNSVMSSQEKTRNYQNVNCIKNDYQNAYYNQNESYSMYSQGSNFYMQSGGSFYQNTKNPLSDAINLESYQDNEISKKFTNSSIYHEASSGPQVSENQNLDVPKKSPSFPQWPDDDQLVESGTSEKLFQNVNFFSNDEGETNNLLSSISNPYHDFMNKKNSTFTPTSQCEQRVTEVDLNPFRDQSNYTRNQDDSSTNIFASTSQRDLIQTN